jgi:2-phosphosulfolactate phosphatase
MTIAVKFSPADYEAVPESSFRTSHCVVFDVLRATTTMLTALNNGARQIVPVREIPDALRLQSRYPGALLAGERDGRRIRAIQKGGVDFDLGNSPREFTRARVTGHTIIMTTTNGTRAIDACRGAIATWIASFPNLDAIATCLAQQGVDQLLILCAGTYDSAAFEDILAAGALCQRLRSRLANIEFEDSAQVALQVFSACERDMTAALKFSRNARRLASIEDLAADIPLCFEVDTLPLVAALATTGEIRVVESV